MTKEELIQFLKEKIEKAGLFIEAFKKREETLNTIMQAIISLQYDYFVAGEKSKFKPLKYEDIKKITGTFATQNIASQKVMEKLGMTFDKDTEYSKFDESQTFKAKIYSKLL